MKNNGLYLGIAGVAIVLTVLAVLGFSGRLTSSSWNQSPAAPEGKSVIEKK
jgi:Na+-transporting methylmalonyl-CoA/oxaloacetate decarboxylase gamma subunit